MDDWKVRIKTQIKGELDVNPTGQALADLIHEEQKSWRKKYGGCRIKLGKHAEGQEKGKNTETKLKTPSLKGFPY